MRGSQRLIALSVLIALAGALGGCTGGMANFDPSDLLDWMDTKKKLQGERKPVFPEGVPGLEQGVPKDLYKGSRQEQIDQQNTAAAPPLEPPPGSNAAKSKAKSKQATAPAPQPAAAADPDAAPTEEENSVPAAPPPPKQKIVRRRTTAPPPDPAPQQQAQPAQQQQSAFPAPLPSGSFSR
ncbi:MAG: hypothetical protein U1E61_06760 [Bradyrhizobium sp.]